MTTLLITGIDNFVGHRAAQIATKQGFTVRGLPATVQQFNGPKKAPPGVELINARLSDVDALKQACTGVDVVWHTDSVNDFNATSETLNAVNVAGTLHLANQAELAGVQTLIHLSNVIVYGTRFPENATEETSLPAAESELCRSKIEVEQQLLTRKRSHQHEENNAKNNSTLKTVVIRAGDVYGPGAPTWILQPLSSMLQQKFFLANGGKGIFNHLYIDNLVEALLLATEKASNGSIFNITDGARTTWREFYTQLAEMAGQSPPASMPALAMRTAVKLRGKKLGLTVAAVDMLCRQQAYSIEKARRELGYVPKVTLDEGMAEVSNWLRSPASPIRKNLQEQHS